MKKSILLLCLVFLLSLAGCTPQSPAPEPKPDVIPPKATEEPVPSETKQELVGEFTPAEKEETEPTEEEVPDPTVSDESPKAPIIETKYYTLPLPDEWKETCFYTVTDEVTVTLREAYSYEAFEAGKLCTLMLMPTSDDTYKDFPDYELLCALDTPDGSFYVIALFPSDVQFNEDTVESYNAMADTLMDVLWNLQPKDGIEMAMP